MDDDAWIEAWIHRKPRRIIHSQFLIETLLALAFITPLSIAGISIWLIFGFCPVIVIPAILVTWLLLLVPYATLKLCNITHKKKR